MWQSAVAPIHHSFHPSFQAYRVAPRVGSVLVFPHGGAMGSLVHEGSAVTRGAKYIIRTDVLYTIPGHSRHNA